MAVSSGSKSTADYATSGKQDTGNASLASIDTKLTNPLPVSVASLPLPAGAATETTLSALNTKVPSNLTVTATRLLVDGSGVTQPISAASLPLPTGAATETTLAAINTKTPALGQALMAASTPVVIASNQSAVPISAASLPLPTGAATESTLSTLNGKVPSNLTVTATRLLVDGSGVTQPISAVSLPLPTGAATETTLSALNTKVPANLTVTATRLLVDGSGVTQPISAASLPLPTGAATETTLAAINTKTPALGQAVMASSVPVVIASNQSALPVTGTFFQATQPISAASLPLPTGAATSANQATANASLSSIDAGIPAALGQTTMANSMPVVLPSDYSLLLSPTSNRSELSQRVFDGNGYVTSIATLTANTTETNLIYITNPNGSGKTLYIAVSMLFAAMGQSNWMSFQMYISPTTTANGTAMTISNLLPGSVNTSVASAFSGPTTSAKGILSEIQSYGASNSAPTNATSIVNLNPYIVLPPNTKFLLTGTAKAASTGLTALLKWFEV